MTDNPNRCPHCWSSLPAACDDFCPHCGRGLAPKARRRGRGKPVGAATSPSTQPPAPAYTPYEPYVPPAPPDMADMADTPDTPDYAPYEPYVPASPAPATDAFASYPPPAPAPAYTLYRGDGPPSASAALSTPASGAVAVLERDPAEFPGQALPPDFFAALPERTRRAPRKLNLRVLLVVAVAGGGAIISAIGEAGDRSAAVDSPARYLVAGACAEYRDITTRMENADDLAAVQDGIVWFQTNTDRFVEAARLDPELQPAADYVVWFNGVIEADFEPIQGLPEGEINDREEPLTQACYFGPGRD